MHARSDQTDGQACMTEMGEYPMTGVTEHIYQEIANRTGGDLYLGVVGPVRTGKSTFVKRVMETFVIPKIENIYQRERAIDELPQSASGKTIMTSEPKFVPEEAVEISPDGISRFSIRLIDSVGYMIPGALGAEEDGAPRMVTTPWSEHELPMTEAAELGTKKIMEDHCTLGIVITTDGSIHDIPREDFIQAEDRAVSDMKATGKPFLVLVNSVDPIGSKAQSVKKRLDEKFQINTLCINCLTLQEPEICEIFSRILQEFPVTELQMYLPRWLDSLPIVHPLKSELFQAILEKGGRFQSLREASRALTDLNDLEPVEEVQIRDIDPGTGTISCELRLKDGLFYQILTEHSGFQVENDGDLLKLLIDLSDIQKKYSKVSDALDQVRETGYGVVMPAPEEMHLDQPQIIRKGGAYGVRLKANAPSIHMMRADIETEINPMIGDEKQSEDMLQYLKQEYEGDTEKLWQTKIFGKTVYELVNEGLSTKLHRMPDISRRKFQHTLSRIINEGGNGLICIILP